MKLQTLKPRMPTASIDVARVMVPGVWREEGQTSAQRGYGYKWQQARAGFLASHPYCVYCLRDAGIEATDSDEILALCDARGIRAPFATIVDHKTPHRGDQRLFWDKSNWQSMCKPHHDGEKRRAEALL